MATSKTLDKHLELTHVALSDTFTGEGLPTMWGRLFGGQVLSQSILAASKTVDEKYIPNSLHAYFLRAGDSRTIILYNVERLFSGRSFQTRRVTALQENKAIFTATIQFMVERKGAEYQLAVDEVLRVAQVQFGIKIEEIPPDVEKYVLKNKSRMSTDSVTGNVERITVSYGTNYVFQLTRHREKLPPLTAVHFAVFAFLSDNNMISVIRMPHEQKGNQQLVSGFSASLDHSIHFHRNFNVDEWMYVLYETNVSRGARGLARALYYDIQGNLLATVIQEGLISPRKGAL